LLGPRTRHGLTAEEVAKYLTTLGVPIKPEFIKVVPHLTDLKGHWFDELFIGSQDLREQKLADVNQWGITFNPNLPQEAKDYLRSKGHELFPDIVERSTDYLKLLFRFLVDEKHKISELGGKRPLVLNFTSDIILKAILAGLGVKQAADQEVVYQFWPAAGSSVTIDVLADNSAKIYYQEPKQASPQLLAILPDYLSVIGYGKSAVQKQKTSGKNLLKKNLIKLK